METSKWKQLCAGLLVGAMLLPVISNVAVHAEETASSDTTLPNATIAADETSLSENPSAEFTSEKNNSRMVTVIYKIMVTNEAGNDIDEKILGTEQVEVEYGTEFIKPEALSNIPEGYKLLNALGVFVTDSMTEVSAYMTTDPSVPTQPTEPEVTTNQWIQSGSKWWYKHADGSYTTNDFERINGSWYYFDASGYMITGWQWIDGTWYYFASSGSMETGWQWIDGTWYYFASSGSMETGWKYISGTWYYFTQSGSMVTGWQWIDGTWYYFAPSGYMETGWQWIDGTWYYFAPSGYMETGWQWIDGAWYYFASSGYMKTGWQWIDGTWYYFTSSGSMVTGWKWINGDCYYFYGNGAMAADTWIDDSYVNGSGKWDSSASDNHETSKPEPTVPTTPPEVTNPPATEPEETEPPAPTECPHNWTTINHPEEGHKQGWCVCKCGQRFKTVTEWDAHIESIIAGPNPKDAVIYHTSWHDDSEWIVDKPAWSETVCSICGAHK